MFHAEFWARGSERSDSESSSGTAGLDDTERNAVRWYGMAIGEKYW
jgi:hypothetical protein